MADPCAKQEFVARRVIERLSGFIQGIGISGPDARQIVGRVIADDPSASEHAVEAKAPVCMLIALA